MFLSGSLRLGKNIFKYMFYIAEVLTKYYFNGMLYPFKVQQFKARKTIAEGVLKMEHISLKYGSSSVEFDIKGAKSITHLHENEMRTIEDAKKEFLYCITEGVIESEPLNKIISPQDQVTVIISDITRFWSRQDILCQLTVEYLHDEIGVPFENIVVLNALGSHRMHTEEEKEKMASSYVYKNVKVVDHDCYAKDLVYVGTTPMGTKVSVNPLAVGRKLICIGSTVHHVMAGYGGGRKSIVPGVASLETIRMNHIHALDPEKAMSDVRVGSGMAKENPINTDMVDAGNLINVDFGINIVVNADGKHSGFFCGNFDKAWRESCRYVQKGYGVPIDKEVDVVIASCGGFPKDMNLYQSTKSLFNAARAVKKGGTLILLAKCNEGGGSKDFFDWIEPLKRGCLDEELRKAFTIGGYIFYAACEALGKPEASYLLSDMEPDIVKEMGFKAYGNIEEILSKVDFSGKDIYIMAHGGSLVPQLQKDYEKICSDI